MYTHAREIIKSSVCSQCTCLQLRRVLPRGPVDALQCRLLLVPAPVRSSEGLQLDRLGRQVAWSPKHAGKVTRRHSSNMSGDTADEGQGEAGTSRYRGSAMAKNKTRTRGAKTHPAILAKAGDMRSRSYNQIRRTAKLSRASDTGLHGRTPYVRMYTWREVGSHHTPDP